MTKKKQIWQKVDDKAKEKGKGGGKGKDGKKKETQTCNFCEIKGHIEDSVGRKILHKCLRKSE